VLLNPRVTAAVLEASPGAVLSEGLGFDRCDAAVVVEVGRGEAAEAARAVVAATSPLGAAVLNAADPLAASLASACPGSVIQFARAENEVVREHLARGGRAALVRRGLIVLVQGNEVEVLAPLDALGCRAEDGLAAAAAAWALGLSAEAIRAGLEATAAAPCG
jgi:cyanophycin synthetase